MVAGAVQGASMRVAEENLSVTLRGNFNPAILHPQWFAAQGLIAAEAASNATLTISHPDISDFSIGWVSVRATGDTLWFSSPDMSAFSRIRDLVLGIFRLLTFTPVNGFAVAVARHFKTADDAQTLLALNRFGPSSVWTEQLVDVVPDSLRIVGSFGAGDGRRALLTVEPSRAHPPGIFMSGLVLRELQVDPVLGTEPLLQAVEEEWDSTVSKIESLLAELRTAAESAQTVIITEDPVDD